MAALTQVSLLACWLLPLAFVIFYFNDHSQMSNTLSILMFCFSLCSLLLLLATAFTPTSNSTLWTRLATYISTAGSNSDAVDGSVNEWDKLISDLKRNMKDSAAALRILTTLRRKLHKNEVFALESAKGGLLKYSILCVTTCGLQDARLPAAMDVINEMLSSTEVRRWLQSELGEYVALNTADSLLEAANILFDRLENGVDVSDGLMEDESASLLATEAASSPESAAVFLTFGYKLILAIGLLASDGNDKCQTRLGDKGAVKFIVKCLKTQVDSVLFSKWCCWTLIQLTEHHPPNKRAFVISGGIKATLVALHRHAANVDVHHQGLVLLYFVLSPDSQTKMNLSEVRQAALAAGIVDIIQKSQRQFSAVQSLQTTAAGILDILIADWS